MLNADNDREEINLIGYCLVGPDEIPGILSQKNGFFQLFLFSKKEIPCNYINDCLDFLKNNDCNIYFEKYFSKCTFKGVSVDKIIQNHDFNIIKYHINNFVTKGNIVDVDEDLFNKIIIDIPRLKFLLSDINKNILFEMISEFPKQIAPKEISFYKDEQFIISFVYTGQYRYDENSTKITLFPSIMMNHNNGFKFINWHEKIVNIVNIFSFLCGFPLIYNHVEYYGNKGRINEFIDWIVYDENIYYTTFLKFDNIKLLFDKLYNNYSTYKKIIEKYLYIIDHKDLMPSLTFLTSINCIENLSRVIFQNTKDENRYYDADEFGMLSDCYRKNIGRYSKKGILNEDHANSLMQTFEYSNEHPIRKNLKNVIDFVGKDIQLQGEENCSKFIDNVIKYRNILSHPSEEFCEEDKLKEYNNLLIFIFRFAFFKHVGLDVENLKKNLFYHYGLPPSYPNS